MLNFIMMVVAVAMGTLLASIIGVVVLCNKKVMKAYLKWVNKMTMEITDELFDNQKED